MSSEEFRRHGKALIDWIADYWDTVADRPILPDVNPGDIRAMLPDHAPEAPEPFEQVMADLDRVVLPGVTHWQSPGWFAYFPANASFPAILGELAAAGLAQQGMLWQTSPATTEIESAVLDWLVDLMGLPTSWKTSEGPGGGVLQMSASDSTHTAIAVARMGAAGRADPSSMVVYTSQQAHSSIEKGARVAGVGHVRSIECDEVYAMRPEALEAAIVADRADGLEPMLVSASIGTTGTTAVDPVGPIGEIAHRHGLWFHVDAAYAGSAMICAEFRHHLSGIELADSYTFNPHKWLLTNFDCSVFWVADRRTLIESLSILPPYLRNTASETGEVIDYRDWHVPLGRRFRALKLWFVLRSYGAEGLRDHIRRHVALAQQLTARVKESPVLHLVAPTTFGLVSFAHVDGPEATRALGATINASGWAHVTMSALDDEPYIRVSIGSTLTERRHVDRLWELIASSV